MFADFYRDRSVVVTGHTGFKGAWLSLWLHAMGARVHGFSIGTVGRPSFHELLKKSVFKSETRGDVRNLTACRALLRKAKPDLVFHLAAQPLVRKSYAEPLDTLTTNALGTATLLEAMRKSACPASIVVVTTDKCYENQEWQHGYREGDPLGGHDVYSASKAAAEVVAHSWRRSFFQSDRRLGGVATARGGNVIGGGDYAADRLIPDCVRALLRDETLNIRNPEATRPWQHVLDCLSGYLTLGARLATEPDNESLTAPFNFGPDARSNQSVRELVARVRGTWPCRVRMARARSGPHEAALLQLSTAKATAILKWLPVWSFQEAVDHTMAWYARRHLEKKGAMAAHSREQLEVFADDARRQGLEWACQS